MYNKVFLIGRLVKDPEMKLAASGVTITRFVLAVNKFSKKDDANQQTADFLRIVTFRRLAEICNEYLKKGRQVAIEGQLQIHTYEKDGEQKTMAEIVADNMHMLEKQQENNLTE
jgi:single-strand DNA-binding protein